MKVGVLTFHRALNFGAVLQAYATQSLLESCGHTAVILDYRNPAIESSRSVWKTDRNWASKEPIAYVAKYLPMVMAKNSRIRAFDRFTEKYLHLVPPEDASNCDIILIGSDQVWNTALTGGEDHWYAGLFAAGKPKIAWAASCPVSGNLPTGIGDGRFEAISVREPELVAAIPGSTLLPDPTILVDPEIWKRIAAPKNGGYVLAYPMKEEKKTIELAKLKADEIGLPLKIAHRNASWKRPFDTAGPVGFLNLIAGASLVVTSSFHGTAFAKIYGKDIVFSIDPESDSRISNIYKSDLSELREDGRTFMKSIGLL